MPKKQKNRNAFYYFMQEWKEREKQRGRTFANLTEVQNDPRCTYDWQHLSPAVRNVYEDMAKQNKTNGMTKRTNIGESLDLLQKQESKQAEFIANMQKYVTKVINEAMEEDTLAEMKFYFIHFNWLYTVEEKEKRYVPVEYAIGEFSLENGIERYHHKLVHIKPELGYMWEAMDNSQNTHKIPHEVPEGEKDFYSMYVDLINFMEPTKVNGKYPPFYAGQSVFQKVPSFFNQLSDAAGCENTFLVYPIEYLFTQIRNATLVKQAQDPIPEYVGEAEFLRNKYSFETNIECDFHKNIDGTSQYCSLAIIRQWAFMICDHCCEDLSIKLIPGVHCPRTTDQSLSNNMQNMSLNTAKFVNFLSMTGVSEEHRNKVSERTDEDELQRRKLTKPLQIIDHSKVSVQQSSTAITHERPLRTPNTRSFAIAARGGKQTEAPNFGDQNFPVIGGRGVPLKKKSDTSKQQTGRGCWDC